MSANQNFQADQTNSKSTNGSMQFGVFDPKFVLDSNLVILTREMLWGNQPEKTQAGTDRFGWTWEDGFEKGAQKSTLRLTGLLKINGQPASAADLLSHLKGQLEREQPDENLLKQFNTAIQNTLLTCDQVLSTGQSLNFLHPNSIFFKETDGLPKVYLVDLGWVGGIERIQEKNRKDLEFIHGKPLDQLSSVGKGPFNSLEESKSVGRMLGLLFAEKATSAADPNFYKEKSANTQWQAIQKTQKGELNLMQLRNGLKEASLFLLADKEIIRGTSTVGGFVKILFILILFLAAGLAISEWVYPGQAVSKIIAKINNKVDKDLQGAKGATKNDKEEKNKNETKGKLEVGIGKQTKPMGDRKDNPPLSSPYTFADLKKECDPIFQDLEDQEKFGKMRLKAPKTLEEALAKYSKANPDHELKKDGSEANYLLKIKIKLSSLKID